MRRLHLYAGWLGVSIFALTGLYLRLHPLPDTLANESVHMLRRSRHIYILASGLIHLMLGLYAERRPVGWQRTVQAIGSALLILSTIFLIFAFAVEPALGFHNDIWRSRTGLYTLALGCLAHVLSARQARQKVI